LDTARDKIMRLNQSHLPAEQRVCVMFTFVLYDPFVATARERLSS